jgi:hypothetical protein
MCELFDRGRATSLHLFEHVHGDSRDRGPAMIDLAQTYEKAGLFLAEGELPDYLPVVLEFASTQPPGPGARLPVEMAHILNAIFSALQASARALRQRAGRAARTGRRKGVQAVASSPRRSLDESWAEPPFDGCSTKGQAKPGQAQPMHFVATTSAEHRRHTRSLPMTAWLDTFLFGLYPYICLAVFLMAAWARFDRDQYTWKSDSSQMLRTGSLRWGSNLFHVGVLFLFFGHFVGMLTPHFGSTSLHQRRQQADAGHGAGGIAGAAGLRRPDACCCTAACSTRASALTSQTSDIVLL